MNESLKKLGLTPVKGLVAAALAVVLVVVWAPMLSWPTSERDVALTGNSPPRPALAPIREQPKRPVSSPTVRPSTKSRATAGSDEQDHLARFSVERAVTHDPFARPSWAVEADIARTPTGQTQQDSARFDALRNTEVTMILHGREGKAAQLGDRVVRVGDRVDGFVVTAIGPAGVYFLPAPQSSNGG